MKTDQTAMFRLGSNHEFDIYFARAALEELEQGLVDSRRGSLPTAPPNRLIIKEPDGVKRTSSCKYPSRTRKKASSPSDRHSDQESQQTSDMPTKTVISSTGTDTIKSEATCTKQALDCAPPINFEQPLHIATPTPSCQPVQEPQAPATVNHSLLAPETKFDFKCHSAPHSRSSSWKKGRRPRSGEAEGRPRTGSVPLEDSVSQQLEQLRLLQADDCCVVRNFTISPKGLVNRGDSFKRKSFSVASEHGGSVGSGLGDPEQGQSVHSLGDSTAPSSGGPCHMFRVALAGAHGVGKTALVQQFMTSEYMGALDSSFDQQEVTLSVLLDGEETMLDLHNIPPQTDVSVEPYDAHVVVYSMTDRSSFLQALDLLNSIRRDKERHPAIILVANKSDLVRGRQVSTDEGREVCLLKDCKYIEVSAALNHKVDDLLVGVVTQIRLQPQRRDKRRQQPSDDKMADMSCSASAKGLLHKLFKRHNIVSKSCDNLMIL